MFENSQNYPDVLTFSISKFPSLLNLSSISIETLEENEENMNFLSLREGKFPNQVIFGNQEMINPLVKTFTNLWIKEISHTTKEKENKVVEQDGYEPWLPNPITETLISDSWKSSNFNILHHYFNDELQTNLFEATKNGEKDIEEILHKQTESCDLISGLEFTIDPSSIFYSGSCCFALDYFNDELPKRPKILFTTSNCTTSSFIELHEKADLMVPLKMIMENFNTDLKNQSSIDVCLSYYSIWKSFRFEKFYNPPLPMCIYPETNIVLPFYSFGNEEIVGFPSKDEQLYSVYFTYMNSPVEFTKNLASIKKSLNFLYGSEMKPFSHILSGKTEKIKTLTSGLSLFPLQSLTNELIEENKKEILDLDEKIHYRERLFAINEAFRSE